MKIQFDDKEEILNETLKEKVVKENKFKEMIVNYVGEDLKPENDEVTIEMVVEVLANNFPEVVLVLAEENFVRGYTQALTDVETGEKLKNEEIHKESTKQA